MCKSDKSQIHHHVYSYSMVPIFKNKHYNGIFLRLEKESWKEIF